MNTKPLIYIPEVLSVYVGDIYTIEHDGFRGSAIGCYETKEGKIGVVLQQIGTRVVHVYGVKWLKNCEGNTNES